MEKALVFIWGQLTLFPLLTPILTWPILWFINRHFLRKPLERVNAALIFFIGIAIVTYATIFNFTEGPKLYFDFLAKRGVETEATVISVHSVMAIPQFEKTDEVVLQLRTTTGRTILISHQTETRRFYPIVEGALPPPKVGDKIRIRYFPNLENGFVVLTDSDKSGYGEQLNCIRINQIFTKIEKQYKFAEYPDSTLVASYREIIEEILRTNCLTLAERDNYRALLERLSPGTRH